MGWSDSGCCTQRRGASTGAASSLPAFTRRSSCSDGRRCCCPCWASPISRSIFAAAGRSGPGCPRRGHDAIWFHPIRNNGELPMEVILLERVAKLGQIGDVVRVKDGFARNFLLPKGKALRATQENKTRFESMISQLEARNLELRSEAAKLAHKLEGRTFAVLRQAAESGQLYGSVSARDLAVLFAGGGFMVDHGQIELNAPIKTIGLHHVPISLHPEVAVTVTVNVARSAEEAERLARGESVLGREAQEEAEPPPGVAAESFFEKPKRLERDQVQDAEKAG